MKVFFNISTTDVETTDFWIKTIETLREAFTDDQFVYGKEQIEMHLADCDVIVTGRISETKIDRAKKLKALFIPFAGTDAFPLEKLKENGILVSNSHASSPFVAERTLALALALLGKVCHFDNSLRNGMWHRNEFWTSLRMKKVGIWGAGHIGKDIAKLFSAFDCEIFGVRNSHKKVSNIQLLSTYEMIEKSDIIISCLPLTKKTTGLISWKYLSLMHNKYFINVGRGGLVIEKDLWKATEEGVLKGLALDAWFNYPKGKTQPIFPSSYPFHELDNVVLSPHACSHAKQARYANITQTAKNIQIFIEKGQLESPVNLGSEY